MSLKDDWTAYVGDPSLFKMSHFENLLDELETEALLQEAFGDLPAGKAFIDGLIELRRKTDASGTYLLPSLSSVEKSDRANAEKYRDAVFDRLKEIDDPDADAIVSSPIVEISKADYTAYLNEKKLALLDAPMTIGQDFIIYTAKNPKWIRGLYEAVYMMTTIPEVTRALLSPIAGYPLNETPALELWLRGHRVDFCEDKTLLIVGGA